MRTDRKLGTDSCSIKITENGVRIYGNAQTLLSNVAPTKMGPNNAVVNSNTGNTPRAFANKKSRVGVGRKSMHVHRHICGERKTVV